MPAYWLARARITDPVAYRRYPDRIPGILARHGGRQRLQPGSAGGCCHDVEQQGDLASGVDQARATVGDRPTTPTT